VTWIANGICPVCGHCGSGGTCLNCEDRGRIAPLMRQRTRKDAEQGIPTPLFYETPTGVELTWLST
jgi:hypothetical protein